MAEQAFKRTGYKDATFGNFMPYTAPAAQSATADWPALQLSNLCNPYTALSHLASYHAVLQQQTIYARPLTRGTSYPAGEHEHVQAQLWMPPATASYTRRAWPHNTKTTPTNAPTVPQPLGASTEPVGNTHIQFACSTTSSLKGRKLDGAWDQPQQAIC